MLRGMGREVALSVHAALSLVASALYVLFVLPRWWELTGDTSHTLGNILRILTGVLIGLAALPVAFTLLRTRDPELGTPRLALSLRLWSIAAHVLSGVVILGTAISEFWIRLDVAGPYLFAIYGAAAAIVCNGATLKSLSLEQRRRAVKVSASVLTTDPYEEGCQVLPNVNTLTRNAATTAYQQAGVGPGDLDLVELHDCFATAELVHYDNLMLCDEGGAADFFNSGATWRDGSTPVNVSGGLESKGHPIAATGIANIWEICHHLRGEAGDRQIANAKVGLAHVIGLGSACGIHILERSAA